jgi:hypothetical protein
MKKPWRMQKVPQVSIELLKLANEVLTRPEAKLDLIKTLLREQRPKYRFDEIYAASQRLMALWRAIMRHRLEEWTGPLPGSREGTISDALWMAAAEAKLQEEPEAQPSFDAEELMRLARSFAARRG